MAFNRIKEILEEKGIREIKLTDDMLQRLGITDKMWTKWINGSNDPNLNQLPLVAALLDTDIYNIIPMHEEKIDS
jgi:transcriptional regulator with XRE-family HTH domain